MGRRRRVGCPWATTVNRLNTQFEGNGHTVSNLYIHRQDTDSVGLFKTRVGAFRRPSAIWAWSTPRSRGAGYVGILAKAGTADEITGSHATGSVSWARATMLAGWLSWNESGVISR